MKKNKQNLYEIEIGKDLFFEKKLQKYRKKLYQIIYLLQPRHNIMGGDKLNTFIK